MANSLDLMNDEVAASLILDAIKKKKNSKKRPKYDIIVERIPANGLIGGKYVAYTFYAVKKGKAQSAPRALGELVLKDVVSKLLDFAGGEASNVYSLSGDLSGGLKGASGGWMDTKEVYSKAADIGGKMQLHAAKKMGKKTFNMARVYGLGASVIYGGVARFEEVSYGTKGLNIMACYWSGLSGSASWVDRFQGKDPRYDNSQDIIGLDKWGGHYKADYMYSPATGMMW